MRGRAPIGILGFAAVVASLLILAPAATATLTVYDSDTTQELASFDKANCKLKKQGPAGKIRFYAFSLPKGTTYSVALFISNYDWRGFGADYPLLYGDQHTIANVFGPGGLYSNEFAIPGTPPDVVGGGAIKFSPNGKRVSAGLAPAPNASFTQGVIFAGAMKCVYPKRR